MDPIVRRLRENRKLIKESVKIVVGNKFENAGHEWIVKAKKGEYTYLYAPNKKLEPHVVAWHLELDTADKGSWSQGHYFSSEESAMNFLKKQSGVLER